MKMMVGLGNPGKKYEATRHNVGFITLDLIADRLNAEIKEKNFQGLTAELFYKGEKVILVKPQTYMNLSGQCVGEIARYYKIENEDILVIADDLSLPSGTMKLRPQGSSGGHNGLKSIIACLGGDDFSRLKIGIGRGKDEGVIDHVLGHFGNDEWKLLSAMMEKAGDCAMEWLKSGVDDAMCHFNCYSKIKKPKVKKENQAELKEEPKLSAEKPKIQEEKELKEVSQVLAEKPKN
ncbi:MAG: aminoacyl-tRNA hydrolase [Clostridiales bacterium]